MKTLVMILLAFTLIPTLAVAQVDYQGLIMSVDGTEIQTTALVGSQIFGNLTVSWAIAPETSDSIHFDITGEIAPSHPAADLTPHVIWMEFANDDSMPFRMEVANANQNPIKFVGASWGMGGAGEPYFEVTSSDAEFIYGNLLSMTEGNLGALGLYLMDSTGTWDLDYDVYWNGLVALDPVTMDGVKALYR